MRDWTLVLGTLAALSSLASRRFPRALALASLVAIAAVGIALHHRTRQARDPTGTDQASIGEMASGGDVSLLLALALGLAGAWVAGRTPWEAWTGALIWAGALWIGLRPEPTSSLGPGALAFGAASAAVVGALALRALPGAGSIGIEVLVLVVIVTVGRITVAHVAHRAGELAGLIVVAGVALPLASGAWAWIAIGLEAVFAALAFSGEELEHAWAWALGGLAAGAGILVEPYLPVLF